MDISFVYFDVGQVLVSNQLGWRKFVAENKFSEEEAKLFWEGWGEVSDKICKGSLSPEQGVKFIESKVGRELGEEFNLVDETVKMFAPIKQTQHLMVTLQQKYKVGLLSNSYPGMIDGLLQQRKLPTVYYSVIMDSSEVQLIKPEPKIFTLAAQRAGVKPKEIFLIDDSSKHVDAAQELGWNVYQFNEAEGERGVTEISSVLLK